eukprot:TRINITY_DN3668_c0_g1_i1.p1 TRINITY_DN3668_c0_g1~~TRINITY_DN3668_c0_g1_i1.p1  ORF type:complete len:486 (+),score=121.39 TRINITY_DN3668_c0_g1_i1:11-1468(+)
MDDTALHTVKLSPQWLSQSSPNNSTNSNFNQEQENPQYRDSSRRPQQSFPRPRYSPQYHHSGRPNPKFPFIEKKSKSTSNLFSHGSLKPSPLAEHSSLNGFLNSSSLSNGLGPAHIAKDPPTPPRPFVKMSSLSNMSVRPSTTTPAVLLRTSASPTPILRPTVTTPPSEPYSDKERVRPLLPSQPIVPKILLKSRSCVNLLKNQNKPPTPAPTVNANTAPRTPPPLQYKRVASEPILPIPMSVLMREENKALNTLQNDLIYKDANSRYVAAHADNHQPPKNRLSSPSHTRTKTEFFKDLKKIDEEKTEQCSKAEAGDTEQGDDQTSSETEAKQLWNEEEEDQVLKSWGWTPEQSSQTCSDVDEEEITQISPHDLLPAATTQPRLTAEKDKESRLAEMAHSISAWQKKLLEKGSLSVSVPAELDVQASSDADADRLLPSQNQVLEIEQEKEKKTVCDVICPEEAPSTPPCLLSEHQVADSPCGEVI